MFICAQLDDDDIVRSVARLKSYINHDSVIEIPTYDTSLIGKKYDRNTGEFKEV